MVFSQETQWTFIDQATREELFRQDFNEWDSTDPRVRTVTFGDLEAGRYEFVMEDSSGNGICCSQGNGFIAMSDDDSLLYERLGDFGDALYVDVQVNMRGRVSITEVGVPDTVSEIPSDTASESVEAQPDWPGYSSDKLSHSFSLNIKFGTSKCRFST
jgi:hypothetical protein